MTKTSFLEMKKVFLFLTFVSQQNGVIIKKHVWKNVILSEKKTRKEVIFFRFGYLNIRPWQLKCR